MSKREAAAGAEGAGACASPGARAGGRSGTLSRSDWQAAVGSSKRSDGRDMVRLLLEGAAALRGGARRAWPRSRRAGARPASVTAPRALHVEIDAPHDVGREPGAGEARARATRRSPSKVTALPSPASDDVRPPGDRRVGDVDETRRALLRPRAARARRGRPRARAAASPPSAGGLARTAAACSRRAGRSRSAARAARRARRARAGRARG